MELKSLYMDLFQRSLYAVGELWELNKISVAREHLATAITESLLNLVYPRLFENTPTGKKVVVSCAANELHQIGGKIVADFFELNGWESHFLGANTPVLVSGHGSVIPGKIPAGYFFRIQNGCITSKKRMQSCLNRHVGL